MVCIQVIGLEEETAKDRGDGQPLAVWEGYVILDHGGQSSSCAEVVFVLSLSTSQCKYGSTNEAYSLKQE